MSPGMWRQLIDIYTLPDYEWNQFFIRSLFDEGLIGYYDAPITVEYCGAVKAVTLKHTLTEKGRYMMKMLDEIPFPVQKWVDPRNDNELG